jgi:hypothetical protein
MSDLVSHWSNRGVSRNTGPSVCRLPRLDLSRILAHRANVYTIRPYMVTVPDDNFFFLSNRDLHDMPGHTCAEPYQG